MASPSARPLVQLCPSGGNVYRPSFESVHGVKNPSNRPRQNDNLNLLSDCHFVCAENLKNVSICCVSIFGEGQSMRNLNYEGFRFSLFISKS